jgi:hypothetical protein
MPESSITLVLHDKKGKRGWEYTENEGTVYSYDPTHSTGSDEVSAFFAPGRKGMQFVYGPPFDSIVARLKLHNTALARLVITKPLNKAILAMISELSEAGLFGDNTQIVYPK